MHSGVAVFGGKGLGAEILWFSDILCPFWKRPISMHVVLFRVKFGKVNKTTLDEALCQ